MCRACALFLGCLFLLAGSLIAILVVQAAPGPQAQVIHGLALGDYNSDGFYVSGKRLHCQTPPLGAEFASECSLLIAGKQLTVLASRNDPADPNQLGGVCTAVYDGQTLRCSIGFRHVHTPWFAFVEQPPQLSSQQLEQLRQQYWVENLPETSFLQFILAIVISSMVFAILVILLWFWPMRSKKAVVLSAAYAVLACFASGIAAIMLTSHFWD